MAISDEITRLQSAKSALKTAIEGKGVTVPSSTKLDGYADLVDSIETGGGGGTAPYIVNPLNGANFGDSANAGGLYSHQYQISEGNIIDAYFAVMNFSNLLFPYSTTDTPSSSPYHQRELNFSADGAVLEITETGLMTLTLVKASSTNLWLASPAYYLVILVSDLGTTFVDRFGVYNRNPCFIKNTNIILSNRTNKKIQDITYDDELLVWNFDEGKYDSAKPLWIKKAQTTTWYYRLTFSDGTVLKVTGDYPKAHSLYSVDDGKFIHANELVGKKVYTLNGIQTLEKCEETHEEVEFYNIITDYHMNLFAEGILTSTSLNNLYPIEKMTFVKEDREPVFDTSIFEDKWIKGLRLNEQPNDVTDYVNNVIQLAIDDNGFDNF